MVEMTAPVFAGSLPSDGSGLSVEPSPQVGQFLLSAA